MIASSPSLRDWTAHARFYEYSQAADPPISAIPIDVFPPERHAEGPTRILPWDLSAALGTSVPATAPGLWAGFLRILAGETLAPAVQASSQLLYVISGEGTTRIDGAEVHWGTGDVLTLPAPGAAEHRARATSVLYWVHDAPLLAYLGAAPMTARFPATHYPRAAIQQAVAQVRAQPGAERRNRMGVILGNTQTSQTMTITHGLWSLYNVIAPKTVQKPHRHQSVALDLCVAAEPGVYTLMSRQLAPDGSLRDPVRCDWRPGGAFLTPPGWWHAHHNESDREAHVLPVQDAGVHTYLRTLDIQFAR